MAKILFIDDDLEIRSLYVPFLRRRLQCQNRSKYNRNSVTVCESGPQAMTILQSDGNFDVIICDYCMPLENGGAVWNLVRNLYPHIPFILFTSKNMQELPEFDETFLSRGNVWLQKPASPEKLFQSIHSLISLEAASSFMA